MNMITWAFVLSSLVVIVSPGPDAALILHQVLRHQSRCAGLTTAAGMLSAGAFHAACAVTGASLILLSHPRVLWALQLCGAALLISWGLRGLWGAALGVEASVAAAPERAPCRRFVRGFACTATNPKVSVFLLTFLPQFLPAGRASAGRLALLAGTYLALGACWLVTLTEIVFQLRERLIQPRLLARIQRAAALGFIAVGVRLALGA
jgi:threonine/homoserine/homoserine lactone efflux protein